MSTDCSALPRGWSTRTPRFRWPVDASHWDQLTRLARVSLHVLRMWLGAVLIGDRLSERWREPVVRHLAAHLLAILRVRIEIHGEVPPSVWPVLMVVNHVSWLDTYVVNALHGARFVAKSEVATWPLIGTIARRFGTLFIVRRSLRSAARTKDAAAGLLRRGLPVAIFPEGTTTDGRRVGRFYPALLQAAIDAQVPVQPIAIAYRGHDGQATSAAAFIDDMTVFTSLRQILRERTLVAEVRFGRPLSCRGQTRREVARRAREAIISALAITDREPECPAPSAVRPWAVIPERPTVAPPPSAPPSSWQEVPTALPAVPSPSERAARTGASFQTMRNALRMAHGGTTRG